MYNIKSNWNNKMNIYLSELYNFRGKIPEQTIRKVQGLLHSK